MSFKINSLYLTDGYKVGHKAMLAPGTTRTINGSRKNQTPLGNITMYSAKDKGYRTVNPNTIRSLVINETTYVVS